MCISWHSSKDRSTLEITPVCTLNLTFNSDICHQGADRGQDTESAPSQYIIPASCVIQTGLTLTGDRVIISPEPRGKILAWAIISSTLVFPALWSPTTTTWERYERRAVLVRWRAAWTESSPLWYRKTERVWSNVWLLRTLGRWSWVL